FVSVAVVDSGNFKGADAVTELEAETRSSLEKYVQWCHNHGLRAAWRMATGTEAIGSLETLCREVQQEFKRSVFFGGKLVFREGRWYHGSLHNETGYALQRRLQFAGLATITLPIRILEEGT